VREESGKNVELGPLAFLVQQILMVHPVPVPRSGRPASRHLLVGRGRAFRALGVAYLALLGIFMALHGKNYYLAPAYPMLFAAGGVAFEAVDGAADGGGGCGTASARCRRRFSSPPGALTAPLSLPLLDPPTSFAYQASLGVAPEKTEVAHDGPLPQLWGDQFGWPELAADVAAVVRALPLRGPRPGVHLRQQLRRGRGAQPLRPGARAAAGDQRPPDPLLLGPQGLPPGGGARRQPRTTARASNSPCNSVEEAGHHEHPWGNGRGERRDLGVPRPQAPLSEAWPR